MLLLSSSSHADLSIFLDAPVYTALSSMPLSASAAAPSTGSAAPPSSDSDHPMDVTEERKEAPSTNGTEAPPDALSPMQLVEFESALCALHRSFNSPASSHRSDELGNAAQATENEDPLFFFTTGEWNAFCRQVTAAMSRSTFNFQLAECERLPAISQRKKVDLKHENDVQPQNPLELLTADAFKTVFVPKMDAIQRVHRMRT